MMGPLKWDYQARSDGHSSGSAARIPPPNFADSNFCKRLRKFSNFLSILLDEHIRPCVQTERDDTFLHVSQHRPPSGAVVAAPACFHSNPRDWGVQHLGSQGVRILFLSANPPPDHPRAQHWVVASQILKTGRNRKRKQGEERAGLRETRAPLTHLRPD